MIATFLAMHMVQVAVVQVVGVAVMLDGGVTAAGAVDMVVMVVLVRHLLTSCVHAQRRVRSRSG